MWKDTLRKHDWSKKPSQQPTWEGRLISGIDKYMAFWTKLYTKMANAKLTPSRIKTMALIGAVEFPRLYEVAKEQYFDEMSDERSKELKELIEQAMREN